MPHEDRVHFPAPSRNLELLDVGRGRNIRRIPWQLLLASLIGLIYLMFDGTDFERVTRKMQNLCTSAE